MWEVSEYDSELSRTVPRVTRIVAGVLGGRRLAVPPGDRTRPTSDRVREAVFSTLESLIGITDTKFADLYAGSGAVGLEALSRGASEVLLVESDPRTARITRSNIATLSATSKVRLVVGTVAQVLTAGPGESPYDVVFADPPYSVPDEEITRMLTALVDGAWLAPDAVVAVERSSRSPAVTWVPGITGERSRRYGETVVWYGRRS